MTAQVIELRPKEIPDDVWECQCGSYLFYINPEGCTCSKCGTYQVFKD
jgi:hypothetical protein